MHHVRTRIAVAPRLIVVAVANLLAASLALILLLPSPWGSVVPIALMAQVAWLRHGLARTLGTAVVAAAAGAGAAPMLGIADPRRTAVAMLLVVLPLLALWPPRESSARG